MKKPTILILAGGRGTRIASLYPDLPKPMIPVAEKPFLFWLVRRFVREGCHNFVFSLGHKADQIESWLKNEPLMQDLDWKSFTETKPLGTGGGALTCLPLCSSRGEVLITNGDSLLLSPLPPLWDRKREDEASLQAVHKEDASRYGSLKLDENKNLAGFYEKRPGAGLINGGLYLFPPSMLSSFPQNENISMEYDILPTLIEKRKTIKVVETAEETPFIDIGTPKTVAKASAFIEKHKAEFF